MGKSKALTPNQRVLVDEYLVDRNASRAYKVAFPDANYDTCRSQGRRLVTKPNIQEEIRAASEAQQKRTRVRADAVIREAARIAFADPYYLFEEDGITPLPMHKIPIETRRVIAAMKSRVECLVPAGPVPHTSTCPGCGHQHTASIEMVTRHSMVEFRFVPKLGGLDKLFRHLGLQQEITPLESLLASLPEPIAAELRKAMATTPSPAVGQS